jgi:protein PsiE
MLEAIRRLSTATGNLHRDAKESADTIGTFLVDAFHFLALFVIGATTVWSAATAFMGMVLQGRATLGDILLLGISKNSLCWRAVRISCVMA